MIVRMPPMLGKLFGAVEVFQRNGKSLTSKVFVVFRYPKLIKRAKKERSLR